MVALQRDSARATEAAMKYFVLGALASGLLLYGISMLYGATGTLEISGVAQAIYHQAGNKTVLMFGWCSWWLVSRSSSVSFRSTCGFPTSITGAPRSRS
jgi:NADH:ubiquinone oxidoreductase subunit 2 (subunit N)